MKALVLQSSECLKVMDVPQPALRPGEVLIRVHKCGLCGSDVRYSLGENPWAKQTLGREVPNPPNIIFGHEFVGTVEKVQEVKNEPLLGRRVGVQTWVSCGRCAFCREGKENLCEHTRHLGHGQGWGEMDFYPGGMAEFCPAFADNVYPLDDEITDDQATFFDPMTAAIHAVDVGRPKPLDRVVILGAGPIGLLIAQMVKAYGAQETFITDLAKENLRVAAEVGVDHAIDVSGGKDDELAKRIREQTAGQGVEVVFNTVGSSESIAQSLTLVRKGGTLVLLATKEDEIRFPSLGLSGERSIRTSSNAMARDFGRVIQMLSSGRVRVEPLITHRFALHDATQAFAVACDKQTRGAIKVIIEVA